MSFDFWLVFSAASIGVALFIIYYLSETVGKAKMEVCLNCREPMSTKRSLNGTEYKICDNCGGYCWIWDWV
jgi:hypothetical protein